MPPLPTTFLSTLNTSCNCVQQPFLPSQLTLLNSSSNVKHSMITRHHRRQWWQLFLKCDQSSLRRNPFRLSPVWNSHLSLCPKVVSTTPHNTLLIHINASSKQNRATLNTTPLGLFCGWTPLCHRPRPLVYTRNNVRRSELLWSQGVASNHVM